MEKNTAKKLVLSFVFILLCAGCVSAGFTRSFLSVKVLVNDDGSASIREELRFTIDDAYSIDSYSTWIKSANDLSGWKLRTQLNDIRYHLDSNEVSIKNTRLLPRDPDTCNFDRSKCYGTFVLEYDIDPPTESKGFVWIDKYKKPRTIDYLLNKGAFSFESTVNGEKYIPELTSLEITMPIGNLGITSDPKPVEYADKIPDNADKLTWQGYISIKNFDFRFSRKETLSYEVNDFFKNLQDTTVGWLTSQEGMIITAAGIIILASYLVLQRRKAE